MTTVREEAIACITEKLRELASIENAQHAALARSTHEIGNMSYQTFHDRRAAAELHYVTADYYELLAEAITAIPLFDELDQQFPREEPMTNRDVDPEHVAECDRDAEFALDAADEERRYAEAETQPWEGVL